MEKKESVWKQIEEDEKDYQYFKKYDDAQLEKTLETIRVHRSIQTLQ